MASLGWQACRQGVHSILCQAKHAFRFEVAGGKVPVGCACLGGTLPPTVPAKILLVLKIFGDGGITARWLRVILGRWRDLR